MPKTIPQRVPRNDNAKGLVVAAVVSAGRQPRSRLADLLIAATAHANGLGLYTCNGDDFDGRRYAG